MTIIASETLSIDIAAPRESVWKLITRARTIPSWYDGWNEVIDVPENDELAVGARFTLVDSRGTRTRRAKCRVLVVVPQTQLTWTETEYGEFPKTVEFSLSAVDPRSSRLTLSKYVDLANIEDDRKRNSDTHWA